MKTVKAEQRFNLQELLEFFRPHCLKLEEAGSANNVVALKLGNFIKDLSEPPTRRERERSVCHIRSGEHADIETLSAIFRGEDVIVGGLLNSDSTVARPPFLVRKHGLHSSAGRFHYEVWACVESAPTDPMLLLELCASLEAVGEAIGTVPRLLKVAVLDGSVYDFDTRALLLMYGKIKDMFYETRSRGVWPARLKNSRASDRCSLRTLY
jgi:hypothetical protein